MRAQTATRIAALAWFFVAAALGAGAAGCPGSGNGGGKKPSPPEGKKVTVFALAEVRGQIEPCGCTTDPLGDLARTTALVQVARNAGPTAVLDAGSLLYSQRPVPPHLDAQEKLKSDLLVKAYQEELQVAAIGLGPMDLAKGPDLVRPPRQAANVAATTGVPVEAPKVIDAGGGVRIGVFGVVSAEMAPGIEVGDPVAAAKGAVATLDKETPDLVVALLTMSKKDAAKLLRAVDGIDFAILGMGLQTPEPKDVDARAEDIDGTWLVVPGNRGQVVPRLEITVKDGDGFTDAVGPAAAETLGADLDARIDALAKELAGFEADPSADPTFVAQKKEELAALRAERQRLKDEPLRAPAKGSWFTLEMVKIKKSLACDPEILAAKTSYSQAAGAANVAAVKDEPPPPAAAGKAGYVGVDACEDCHSDQVEFWNTTRHAGAWETLDEISKQFDHDCTGCHVTGWDRPGGSNMAFNDDLRDVQCEVCHGPGSLHIDAEGDAALKKTILRSPPPEQCATQCHTPEHSDTFQLEAYLRDIVGPGHGGKRRKELGDGPTGRELRAAGLEKAGRTIGAGCVK